MAQGSKRTDGEESGDASFTFQQPGGVAGVREEIAESGELEILLRERCCSVALLFLRLAISMKLYYLLNLSWIAIRRILKFSVE